jgi:multiple RNA-binding domain-containing protein 1
LPDFTFARIKTKTSSAPKDKQPIKLSMGFGFVGFRTVEAAKHALEQMQGTALDGHVLSLKFAHQDASNMSAVFNSSALHNAAMDSKGSNTTVLVKNLPFEASKKEVRQLFEAHGQIKSVRVPRKLDKSARGFAFVEFVSRREASNAMEALKHTHLLGRHLVLKWAQEEDGAGGVGVERARGKARIAAAAAESAPDLGGSKRSKMKLGAQDIALASAQERKQRDDAEDEDEDLA